MDRRPSFQRSQRRGSYVVPFTLFMVGMTLSGALAVDLGTLRLTQQQLRITLDAASTAGASYLDGTSEGMDEAVAAAVSAAQANVVQGRPLELDASDLTFGSWDVDSGTFTPTTDPAEVDAVRIEKTLDEVPTPFSGAVIGDPVQSMTLDAVAVRPPPEPVGEANCFLPVALPSCALAGLTDGKGVVQVVLGNDGGDTAGWGHSDGANASNVSEAMYLAASGDCEAFDSPTVAESEPFPVMNGVTKRVLMETGELLKTSAVPWDSDLWGPKPSAHPDSRLTGAQYPTAGTIQGPIPIVNGGSHCGSIKFNGSMEVEQLAWGVIFDAYTGKGQDKGIQLMIDTKHTFEVTGTGAGIGEGSGNVGARPAGRLVR